MERNKAARLAAIWSAVAFALAWLGGFLSGVLVTLVFTR